MPVTERRLAAVRVQGGASENRNHRYAAYCACVWRTRQRTVVDLVLRQTTEHFADV